MTTTPAQQGSQTPAPAQQQGSQPAPAQQQGGTNPRRFSDWASI